jgi:hypothetical protein
MPATEKEVFGDDASDIHMQYIMYKVASKLQGGNPAPPDVWLVSQTLMLIDKGLLNTIERKEAEDALNQLGWESHRNLKGQLCMRPCFPKE